jgi:predicted enzyme related to lactoylglutathione lyase
MKPEGYQRIAARRHAMIKGLVYAIVTTDDVPRARTFFTEKLGLSTEDDMGDSFSQFTTREGTMWAIMTRPEHAAPLGAELYLLVDNVDEAHRVWKERGVDMVTEPHNEPFGRTFAFKDADGRVLHAMKNP